MLKTSLGIYGLNIRPVGNYRQGQMYTSHTSRSLAKIDLDHRGKRLSKLKNKITVHILHYSYKILCDIAQLHENKCLYHTYKTTVISQTYLFHETTSLWTCTWNRLSVSHTTRLLNTQELQSSIKRDLSCPKAGHSKSQFSLNFSVLTELLNYVFEEEKRRKKNWKLK